MKHQERQLLLSQSGKITKWRALEIKQYCYRNIGKAIKFIEHHFFVFSGQQ